MHEFKIIHFSLEISYIKSIVSLAVETATWYSIPLNKRQSSLRNKNSPVMSFIIYVLVARDHATIIRCNFINFNRDKLVREDYFLPSSLVQHWIVFIPKHQKLGCGENNSRLRGSSFSHAKKVYFLYFIMFGLRRNKENV